MADDTTVHPISDKKMAMAELILFELDFLTILLIL